MVLPWLDLNAPARGNRERADPEMLYANTACGLSASPPPLVELWHCAA